MAVLTYPEVLQYLQWSPTDSQKVWHLEAELCGSDVDKFIPRRPVQVLFVRAPSDGTRKSRADEGQ